MKTTINGIPYDIVVIGDDICLQGPDHDMMFERGYIKAREDAEAYIRSAYGVEYTDDEVLESIDLEMWTRAEFHNAVRVNHDDIK